MAFAGDLPSLVNRTDNVQPNIVASIFATMPFTRARAGLEIVFGIEEVQHSSELVLL
jgi:hypothetical protein